MAVTNHRDDKAEESQLRPFVPLSNFKTPSLPTDQAFQALLKKAKKLLRRGEQAPFISSGDLESGTIESIDEIASPPACGPLADELERELDAWAKQESKGPRLKTMIFPPGYRSNLLATWAVEKDCEILAAPSREALLAKDGDLLPDLTGESLLVIPNLERWFLRHPNGLEMMRQLLEAIHEVDRRVLVGCDSWGWTFLSRAVGVDILLSGPSTFEAFDGERLQRWFSGLIAQGEGTRYTYRLAKTGRDVFGDEEKDSGGTDYFVKLAARSRGIPWVAWRIWRSSLRSDLAGEENEDSGESTIPKSEELTLWIVEKEEKDLPQEYRESALLILHALLIHNGLTGDELELVLPQVRKRIFLTGLLASGYLEKVDGIYKVPARVYPTCRSQLSSAGFPIDTAFGST